MILVLVVVLACARVMLLMFECNLLLLQTINVHDIQLGYIHKHLKYSISFYSLDIYGALIKYLCRWSFNRITFR